MTHMEIAARDGYPTYLCQRCHREYWSRQTTAEAAGCFCSADCQAAYLAKYGRMPTIGFEVLLGPREQCCWNFAVPQEGVHGESGVPPDLAAGGDLFDLGGEA